MKGLLFVLILFSAYAGANAQYLSAKDSDAEAIALMTKAGKVFTAGNAQVHFKLKTSFPGQDPIVQDGILYQSGKNYRLELKDYHIISNGTTRWVYMRGPNEVNIYNESSGQDWISPQDFLQLHKSDDLVFTLSANKPDGISIIEAKPLKGRFDEFSKFTVNINKGKLESIKALSSDGTRQEMTITGVTSPESWDTNKLFNFHKDLYPGAYVEDLRLD